MILLPFAYFYGTWSQENGASGDGFRTKILQGEEISSTGENDCVGGIFSAELNLFFLLQDKGHYQQKRKQDTTLTIPLTIRYLYYLLYNTSLEYSSYPTFTVCLLLQLHTYISSELYNAEQVSTWPQASYYYCSW